MMTLGRIMSTDGSHLNCLIPLYEESFPRNERRGTGQLKRMIENHIPMYFNAIECDGELNGMFVYWDMDDFYYLEHLAIFPKMRNKKIGQQALDYVAGHLKGLHPLEIESTEDEIITQHVNYYRCNGYEVLDKVYV